MSCPACGASHSAAREVFQGDGESGPYEMHECLSCASRFCQPRQPASAAFYEKIDEYYGWRWEFDCALDETARFPVGATLLEVGCGNGNFLERANDRLASVGIDINERAVQVAKGKGLRAFACTLEHFEANHPGLAFDVVVAFHVLEHLASPREFLAVARRMMKNRALLLVAVPNPQRSTLLVGHEWWDNPPHHLTRFSRQGLDLLLKASGFTPLHTLDEPEGTSAAAWAAHVAHTIVGSNRNSVPPRLSVLRKIFIHAPLVLFGVLHFLCSHRKLRHHKGQSLLVTARARTANTE